MIWLILFILAILAALYLTAPLLPAKTQAVKLQISLFIALFIGASLGTYNLIGAPELSHSSKGPQANIPQPLQQGNPPQITAMLDGLAAQLADAPEDPEGWTRLIRSRIILGDVKQLIQDHKNMSKVYETRPDIIRKISLDSGFSQFSNEVKASEPSQTSPNQVTPDQITAMVEGLAARLADTPDDPDGWTRLIRSRIVLGDMGQLIQDHKTMTEVYKTRPELMRKISLESGFTEFSDKVLRQK